MKKQRKKRTTVPKAGIPQLCAGLLCIELGGAAELEGCGPILEFDEDVLAVAVGSRLVKFYGTGIQIEVFQKKRMRIRGNLQRVELEMRRETE